MQSDNPIQQLPMESQNSVKPPTSREWLKVSLVLLFALAQGVIHFFLLPPWQHYDEPTHFEYAWLIANRERLPEAGEEDLQMRRDVATSMLEHNFYWNLGQPNLLTDNPRQISIGISELAHPPTYYVLASVPLYFARHLDVTTQLYAARAVSVLIFLLITLIAIGLMRDLVPRDHTLRWLIPLTVVLLPPFASHMTSVNNDVGAVLIFSLFLWGGVRLIRYGVSLWGLLWLLSTAVVGVMTKNTTLVALLMLPLALLIALWVQLGWRWRWFWLAGVAIAVGGLVALFEVGDAAYWYRDERNSPQLSETRSSSDPLSPDEYAVTVEVTSADPSRRLLNPLLAPNVERIRGQTITVGGWLSADHAASEPVEVSAPGVLISEQGSNRLTPLQQPITVTSTPRFFAHTYQIPENTKVAYYGFWAKSSPAKEEPFHLYLNQAFLIAGEVPADAITSLEPNSVPDLILENNLIRNPSGQERWLRLRPWVHEATVKLLRRSPTYIFNALLDVSKSGPFLLGLIAPWLLNDFFSAFAWGHVRLGAEWGTLFKVLVALALLGSLKWLIMPWLAPFDKLRDRQRGKNPPSFLWPVLFFLGLAALLVWTSALLWPLPYQWAKIQFPSGRYLYASIIPTALFLAGGWWALWPRAYAKVGTALWLLFWLFVNLVSITTIRSFYLSLPVG